MICPECGEENPQGSKFCRKCGVNLVYEEPKVEEEPAKKVTVETNQGPVRSRSHTTSSNTNNNNDGISWSWCCICLVFIFIIFAIFGH